MEVCAQLSRFFPPKAWQNKRPEEEGIVVRRDFRCFASTESFNQNFVFSLIYRDNLKCAIHKLILQRSVKDNMELKNGLYLIS